MPATSERGKRTKSGNRMHINDDFAKRYKTLNKPQRMAVDAIDGPVMVVAGPGTGKTQIVAMRVANILQKTHMRPGNILCLTFSNSGVKAMRERLRDIIGSDAYGVTVETVHGFCNEVILAHPHIFENFNALEQVSDIEQFRIVRQILKKMKPGSILGKSYRDDPGSPARETRRITGRTAEIISKISKMKREGISAEKLKRLAPAYKASFNTTPSGKERDKKSKSYKNDLRLLKQFREFCEIYRQYNEKLAESQRYDYDDMILFAAEAMRTNDWLLSELQERYQYLLVDEYQDLNAAQSGILELITKDPTPDRLPNIFIVGDDDQAIYRFQGANVTNMLEFMERFPHAQVITLAENYRSTQAILRAASEVIKNNEERLERIMSGVKKQLISVHSAGCRPSFLRYPSEETELAGMAGILKEKHAGGAAWNDMAVLCRTNNELNGICDALSCADIPVVLAAKQDLLMHPKIRELIVLLRAVENPDNDAALSAALGCAILEFHPADLGKLWCAYRRQRKNNSLREFLLNSEEFSIFNFQFLIIERLHARRQSMTLPELVESAMKDFGLLPKKGDQLADPRAIAALHAIYGYIKIRAAEQRDITLSVLLADIEQYLRERSLKLEYDAPHITERGVQLMTAHAAKGMEFRIVIIPHIRYGNWGNRSEKSTLSLPDNLIYKSAPASGRLRQEDERRLLYVAMTRAKENLILTFSETYRSAGKIRDAQVSAFIPEAGASIEEARIPSEGVPLPIKTLYKPKFKMDEAFESFLRDRLSRFELSVTSMSAFIEDPQAFLWKHFLQMPQAKEPRFAFGSAVHGALEARNRAWQQGIPFGADELIMAFEESIKKEVLTRRKLDELIHDGRAILEKYASATRDVPIILSTERILKARLIYDEEPENAGIPLTGKIDRIDLFNPNGQRCRVIDYKTGRIRKTQASVRNDERLFRQLVFYKLLCDLSPSFTHTATLFTLDFVGNDKDERSVIDMEITKDDVAALKKEIKQVWKKLMSLDFTETA